MTKQQPHGHTFKSLYLHYVKKAEQLEAKANDHAEYLKERFKIDPATGRPRGRSDLDLMIGKDPIWRQLVGDQQFAERHANMYGPGYIAEALGELLKGLKHDEANATVRPARAVSVDDVVDLGSNLTGRCFC
jgi:hypothetical protein